MEVREATELDIKEILEVLKASLGEISSKKTEEVWRYKHIDNPFGKSLVLVALDEGKIVGVRAFMSWRWQIGEKVFSAFRAVDTATHPDYQGKGIFKKLTLAALDIAKNRGDHFVFNTPNSQSKPGYYKMGWEEVSKLQIQLWPVNPFFSLRSKYQRRRKILKNSSKLSLEELLINYNSQQIKKGLFTNKDIAYLNWRYEKNPLQEYIIISKDDYYIAAYIKSRGRIKEFRVSEKICKNVAGNKKANQIIKHFARKYGAHLISCQSDSYSLSFFKCRLKLGPTLTIKSINLGKEEAKFLKDIDNWTYSIGDLELF